MLRTTLFVAAASAVAALSDDSYGQASPVISWSGVEDIFSNSASIVADDVAIEDAASYFKLQQEPKLAVVFSINGMTTSELSQQIRAGEMGSLVEAATSAESQLTIPNTYGSTDGVATFVESLPRLLGVTDKATVYVTSEDSITEDLASDLNVQVISEDTSLERVIAVDENTALLYVALGDDVDSSLTKILEQVDEATDGDYVAFAVPSSYEHSRVVAARKLQSTSGVTGTNAVRCTPQIILGLLVSVFLLFMLHVGFSSMMDIRPNDKHWLDENVPVGNKVEM